LKFVIVVIVILVEVIDILQRFQYTSTVFWIITMALWFDKEIKKGFIGQIDYS
jgi:hypothetical protein